MLKQLKKYFYMIILGVKYIKIFKSISRNNPQLYDSGRLQLSKQRQNYCNAVLKFLNIEVKIYGELPKKDKILYAINHRSLLDIIVMEHIFSLYSKNGTWIAKQELFDAFYGEFFKNSGCVSVDLETKKGLVKFFKNIKFLLSKIDNLNIYIFPEGERNKQEELLAFQNGAEKIASANNLDIVPVFIDDKLEKVFKQSPFEETKIINVHIGEIITNPKNLEKSYKEMVKKIKSA